MANIDSKEMHRLLESAPFKELSRIASELGFQARVRQDGRGVPFSLDIVQTPDFYDRPPMRRSRDEEILIRARAAALQNHVAEMIDAGRVGVQLDLPPPPRRTDQFYERFKDIDLSIDWKLPQIKLEAPKIVPRPPPKKRGRAVNDPHPLCQPANDKQEGLYEWATLRMSERANGVQVRYLKAMPKQDSFVVHTVGLTPTDLVRRKKTLNASEAMTALGLGGFTNPKTGLPMTRRDLWKIKMGIETDEVSMSLPMQVGNDLERYVAKLYADQHGYNLYEVNRAIHITADLPLAATPDYAICEAGSLAPIVGLLECKVLGSFQGWGLAGTDEIPDKYLAQVYVQMMCTGCDVVHVAALSMNREFRVYTVRYSEAVAQTIRAGLAEFWKMVTDKKEPPEENIKEEIEWFVRASDKRLVMERDSDMAHLLDDYVRASVFRKGANEKMTGIKNQILRRMKEVEANVIVDGDGTEVLTFRGGQKPLVSVKWEDLARELLLTIDDERGARRNLIGQFSVTEHSPPRFLVKYKPTEEDE